MGRWSEREACQRALRRLLCQRAVNGVGAAHFSSLSTSFSLMQLAMMMAEATR